MHACAVDIIIALFFSHDSRELIVYTVFRYIRCKVKNGISVIELTEHTQFLLDHLKETVLGQNDQCIWAPTSDIILPSNIVNSQHAKVESLRNTSISTSFVGSGQPITPAVPTETAISTSELVLIPSIELGEEVLAMKECNDKVIKLLLTVKKRHLLATKLAGCIYTRAELANNNHKCLDATKLQHIKTLVFNKFPCSADENPVRVWKFICKKIDDKHRHLKRLEQKRSKDELLRFIDTL